MKQYFLAMVTLVLFLNAGAQKIILNDVNAEVRTLAGNFNTIEVSGGIDLYLSQYETESVAVSASTDHHRQNLKTVIENNRLKIYYDGGKSWNTGNKKLKAYVAFKTLQKLSASGGSDVVVTGTLEVPTLVIHMSGASDFKGTLKVNTLTMELSGASDATLNGTAENMSIQSSGASDLKGYGLITDVCNARASGASDINITVNKELNAHASGASDIYYKGTAVIKGMNSNGSSSISKRN